MIRILFARCLAPLVGLFALAASLVVAADIPATPVLTLYRFNGDLTLPYYDLERFRGRGRSCPGRDSGAGHHADSLPGDTGRTPGYR